MGTRPALNLSNWARPALREEVWVISRIPAATARAAATTSADAEMPGSGSLWTEVERRQVAVPLTPPGLPKRPNEFSFRHCGVHAAKPPNLPSPSSSLTHITHPYPPFTPPL
jgi:hypothetical protein